MDVDMQHGVRMLVTPTPIRRSVCIPQPIETLVSAVVFPRPNTVRAILPGVPVVIVMVALIVVNAMMIVMAMIIGEQRCWCNGNRPDQRAREKCGLYEMQHILC
jgi:hypothetical protein